MMNPRVVPNGATLSMIRCGNGKDPNLHHTTHGNNNHYDADDTHTHTHTPTHTPTHNKEETASFPVSACLSV